MRFMTFVFACLALAATSAQAALYKVQARRLGSEFYELDYGRAYAITRACYEYSYGDDAIVDWSGYSGDILFKSSGNKCDLKKLLGRSDLPKGLYKISVSHEADNLYEVQFQGVYLRTELCLELALGDDAILDWDGSSGDLLFKSGGAKCSVSKILVPLK